MHPELFNIPIIDYPVKSYGAMLTLGFLTGVWLAVQRAQRVKADPDVVLNMGFLCLICGVVGARIFYVIHYWEASFAQQRNPWLTALDCTGGGLEYYGGLIGAIVGCAVYLVWTKRASVRLYLDIMAPSAAWGLAFGRMGCLLNGCCWGGLCVDAHNQATVPWAITFPFSSPAQTRQWEERQITLPAELIVSDPNIYTQPTLLWRNLVDMSVEEREEPSKRVRDLERQIRDMEAMKADAALIERTKKDLNKANEQLKKQQGRMSPLLAATAFPSRVDSGRRTTVSELAAMMDQYRSRPVHPTQIYDVINALLLSWLLNEIFYRRKRHGIVFASLCLIYPITRVVLEIVRVDNPHDVVGLTISQAVSLGLFAFGAVFFLCLLRLPLRSPKAVPYVPPDEE